MSQYPSGMANEADMNDIDAELDHARAALQAAQSLIRKEIAAYPAPIAGCDVQYNRLLALRARVGAAQASLDREEPL